MEEQPGAQPAEPQQQEAATPSAATSKAQAVDAAGSSPAAKGSKPNGLPPVARQSSNLANKIAAFSSGVAPVRKGITNANEDAITVEDVLHKLETSGRTDSQDRCELPVPLIRSAHQHLVAAREEAARTAKELAELKASRVQHIPPSTWIKREQKYKMDQEKYEHTIGQLRQRIDGLEQELDVLRQGSNLQPLEDKIRELEHQLVAAAEEKTKVQSKFHELSIKHRQLIETSPQVATIWNEVLVQQAADGHNAAAMQRLVNFDLRHTAASSSAVNRTAAGSPAPVSAQQLPGVSAAAAIYDNGDGLVPMPAAPHYSSSSKGASEQSGSGTSMQQPLGSHTSPAAAAAGVQPQLQTAEERAHALMAAVALEGLSPEASLAALQQLNYDLTMQLGCYQQMVSRLKDAMEQSDLEKAELEAEKMALELQLAGGSSSERGSSSRGWGLGLWRRSAGPGSSGHHGLDHLEETGSLGDGVSLAGAHSLSSSRRSSMDIHDGGMLAAVAAAGLAGSASSGSATATPTKAAAEAAADGGGGGGGEAATDGSTQQQQDQHKATGGTGGGLFASRRQRTTVRAAAAAETLGKEVSELKRQVKSLQDENRYLVNNLVEIKMELAETQGSHDQAKRALVRAMDKESCLELQVSELRHMLDMSATLNQQLERQAAAGSMATASAAAAAAAGAVAAAAKAAVAAVSSSTPNSAKAAMAALQSPFGQPEPEEPGAAVDADGNDGGAAAVDDDDADAGAAAGPSGTDSVVAAAVDADAEEPAAADAGLADTQQVPQSAAGDGATAAAAAQSQAVASFQLSEASLDEDADASGVAGDAGADGSTEAPPAAVAAAPAAEQPGASSASAAPGSSQQQTR